MTEIPPSSKLFLPLTSEAFEWYNLNKNVEIRKMLGRFKNTIGRTYTYAELRKGYSGLSRYAVIEKIISFENSKSLFDAVEYSRVVPIAKSRTSAERMIHQYVGDNKLIAIFLNMNPPHDFSVI